MVNVLTTTKPCRAVGASINKGSDFTLTTRRDGAAVIFGWPAILANQNENCVLASCGNHNFPGLQTYSRLPRAGRNRHTAASVASVP